MRKRIPRRILTAALSLAMLLTLLPATALANGDTGETTTSGIELSKTATLEDDGTYTINLEAYATGTTTTTTTKSSVPLDIVLVIDQSGSMTDSISSVAYTELESQNYTYSTYGSNSYYYLAEDGNYYKVSRGNAGGWGLFTDSAYYLSYTDNSGVTHYLSGTTTTTSRPTGVTSRDTIIWTGVLYAATTTKLAALKSSVTSFVETIQKDAQTNNVDHRIAIAGFASDENDGTSGTASKYSISTGSSSSYWVNTGLFVSGKLKNYGSSSSSTDTQLTSSDYQSALVSVNDNGSVASSITTAISNFAASGGTRTSYGMKMANEVFANNSSTYTDNNGNTVTRKRIVVVFTDGLPGTGSTVDTTEANSAIGYSNTTKSTGTDGYGATVYTVGLYTSTQDSSVTTFMNYLSSNYPSATSMTVGGTQAATKYYMTASDATELNNVFSTITTDATSSSTSVTLDENAVMKDIMADGFTLTDASKVTVATYSGTADTGGEITFDATATSTFETDLKTYTYTKTGSEAESYTVTKDVENNTVSVTGFDYSDKYISSGHDGEILCVTITGVLPTTDVTTSDPVNTNAAASGIYASADDKTAAAYFPVPETIITKKLYVLDYAKDAELTGLDQSSVTGIVSSYQKVTSDNNTLTQTYGKTALADNALTYTPTTMSWNGYDSFYVFGQTTNETYMSYSANSNGNLWSKVSVIPANNVYYEDDFITTSTDGTTSTGTVGIVYSSDNWEEVGTTSNNTETVNGSTHGWETTLANDTGDSDGSSHSSSTDGATATFTFTGTGVDIYSRTDLTTGTVYAKLTGTDESGNSVTKRLIVDDLAVSAADEDGDGTYYQIPTISFEVEYGTYTVTLTVTNQADDGKRCTYYLDGIRVYNPLGTVTEDDSDAYDAYAADNELNAVFTEVRNILIDANSFTADYSGEGGVVFIDNIPTEEGTGETTTSIATYTDYGPENEVYLAEGQSIAFKVNTEFEHFYLGLKSADGLGTKATVTKGTGTSELTISHSTDLYYEITPTGDGYIMVKNTGSSLLSITKLRATSATAVDTSEDVEAEDTAAIALLSADEVNEILVYAASFDSLETVAYTGTGADEDSTVDTGDTYEDLEEDDVVIDNPTEDTEEEPEETEAPNSLQSLFSSLFNSIRNWFSGRR